MLTSWGTAATFDRLFDDVMGSTFGTATRSGTFEPAVDIRSNDVEVTIMCDVPGLKQTDLEITLENHILTIKGTRNFERRENEQLMLGRAYGTFKRTFSLPDTIDEANLVADLSDGVLSIRIPKQPKIKPRKIEIGSQPDSKTLKIAE